MCLASKVNRESEKLFSVFQERHYLIAVANEFTGYGVRLFSGFAIISKDFTGGIVKSSSISIFHNESSIVSVWAFNVLFHIFQLLFIVYYLHTEGYFYLGKVHWGKTIDIDACIRVTFNYQPYSCREGGTEDTGVEAGSFTFFGSPCHFTDIPE
jgi:hypothetical protein